MKEVPNCMYCDHCTYVGEGDSICIENPCALVLEDFQPGRDFLYCKGTQYIEENERPDQPAS